ncbi:ParA family protein [Thiospirillum jenense]|uniref:ParA family protein n=1 Tax=Thiospirillum jenense TaxID=1653858 RepID=A0A839HDZ1_9GAMM|nr:ParA family protein [Thiospirillum jenense]MBB1126340.1 ParA family protein [Thiospirillum jenense]
MPRITVIGSLKGGSGKSTLTFNLGVWLTLSGIKVQLIDADPQATLIDVTELRRQEGITPFLTIDDRAALITAHTTAAAETLIDIGTADMDAVRLALTICDRIVIPVPPSQADIWSTQRFMQLIAAINRDRPLDIIGFINRGDTHLGVTETKETAAALISLPRLKFIKPRLSQRTIFRRSFSEGLAVFELEPHGKAAQEFHSLVAVLFADLLN